MEGYILESGRISDWNKTGFRWPRTHRMSMVHALVNSAVEVVSLKTTELGIDSLSALGLMNIEHVLRVEAIIEAGFRPARCIQAVLDIGEIVWFSPSSRRCSRRWPVLALF
ncbi:hypothetical protein ARMGADRAFT_569265 [Armillaria gallica]|uniref:Uncharacterized protein n=1 Tax=Armillaria gallica TaxID=47427 RepID=A0A2H3DWC3_ARMGA|nr:hypothetical protein ARMGADRAFT_569265 [Armillaria gallica]